MKDNKENNQNISVNLQFIGVSSETTPEITENINKNVVKFGEDNCFPELLIKSLNNSAIHNAIVTQKALAIAGDDIIYNESDLKSSLQKKVKSWISNVNKEGEVLYDILERISYDYEAYGCFCLEVIWSVDGNTIVEINHIDGSEIRICPKVEGKIVKFLWSPEWRNERKPQNKPIEISAFNPKAAKRDKRQLMYVKSYQPGLKYYGLPSYAAALNYILLDSELSVYYLNNVRNGMNPDLHIAFRNGVPSEEEQHMIAKKLKSQYQGAKNNNKRIITFSENPETTPLFTPIESKDDASKTYILLNDLIIQNILSAHRVTSPMLLGVKTPGQLGGTNELQLAWELFSKQVIAPSRKKILTALNTILHYAVGDDKPMLDITSSPMVSVNFSEKVIGAVLTQDEIREQIGFPAIGSSSAETETPTEETNKVV